MDETLTIEGLNNLFAKQKQDVMAQVNAILAEAQEKTAESKDSIDKAIAGIEKPAVKLEEPARAGILGGITKFEIFGIPLGSALVGGAVAILAS